MLAAFDNKQPEVQFNSWFLPFVVCILSPGEWRHQLSLGFVSQRIIRAKKKKLHLKRFQFLEYNVQETARLGRAIHPLKEVCCNNCIHWPVAMRMEIINKLVQKDILIPHCTGHIFNSIHRVKEEAAAGHSKLSTKNC